MELIDTTCPLCVEPDIALNTMLLRYGPQATAFRRRLERAAAEPDGVLATHWQHLRTAIALPLDGEPPPPDADPLLKTRWAQQQLFRLTFSADDMVATGTQEQIAVHRTKQGTLSSLLGSIRLEAELLGHVEKAKVKGRRQGEREAALKEMQEETVMTPEEQMKLYAATLRLHGYSVQRDVTPAEPTTVIDVTEET